MTNDELKQAEARLRELDVATEPPAWAPGLWTDSAGAVVKVRDALTIIDAYRAELAALREEAGAKFAALRDMMRAAAGDAEEFASRAKTAADREALRHLAGRFRLLRVPARLRAAAEKEKSGCKHDEPGDAECE